MAKQYIFSEEELAKVTDEKERQHLIDCAMDENKVDEEYMRIMEKYDLFEKPETTKKRLNQFCVNDKVVGSVWGDVVTFKELDDMRQADSLGEVKFMQVLNEWNGKRYAFMRDEWNGANYFIEV